MKIALTTVGSRGDIQPYIALAKALIAGGHDAVVVTHPWAKSLIEFYGVPHFPVLPDIDVDASVRELVNCVNPIAGLRKGCRIMERSLYSCHSGFLEAVQSADFVVGHGIMGSAEADIAGKPFVMVALEPYIVPRRPWASRNLVRNIKNELSGAFTYQIVGKAIAKFRYSVKAPPMRGRGRGQNQCMTLIASSRHLLDVDEFWEPPTEITGFFFAPAPASFVPSQELQDFLLGGDAILITLGSMTHGPSYSEKIVKTIVEATILAKKRAIIIFSNVGIESVQNSNNVIFVKNVPYAWLLKHVSLVVHHFGFGTTAEVLRAGLPSIGIPHVFDQYWRVKNFYRKGLTSRPLDFNKMTASQLAEAIITVSTDNVLRHRIVEFANKMVHENGVDKAVEIISHIR